MYRRSPESLYLPPPEGPNSGYLVLHDEESDEVSCCGCIDNRVRDTPFPQNEDLTVGYGSDDDPVAFIPVLDQPLSSNRYHVIHRRGRHKGYIYASYIHYSYDLFSRYRVTQKKTELNLQGSMHKFKGRGHGDWLLQQTLCSRC